MEAQAHAPLYNSRIIKIFIEYLERRYPTLDIEKILSCAGMARYSVDDQAHWFSQRETDRFYDVLVQETQNNAIARDAGRYAVKSGAMAALQQYGLGMLGISSIYLLMGKLYAIMSRGAVVDVRKLGSNRIEIIARPAAGVQEKLYQCQNRLGIFESLAEYYTGHLAEVQHPECYHEGGAACRYIISWKHSMTLMWRRVRNIAMAVTALSLPAAFFFLPPAGCLLHFGLCCSVVALSAYEALRCENRELVKTIETQGDAAKDLLDEINIRHRNSKLVQEIGQALSHILDQDEMVRRVVNLMVRRMDFDRGMILLANADKTRLIFQAGYGYNGDHEALLRRTRFHLDNPESKGPFVLAFHRREPYLINDIRKVEKNLSPRSMEFVRLIDVQSLICVPILFEKESLGILAVDNRRSKKPFTESDVHLLTGVAFQIAFGIVHSRFMYRVHESEKKYRELVENANSIVMRFDAQGDIGFFNAYGRRLFGYQHTEVLNRNVCDTILPQTEEVQQEFTILMKRLQKEPERKVVNEIAHRIDNETVWIAWTYQPVYDKSGNFREVLCIGTDITELKRAEAEKQDLEVQLQRARKMEALGTLAGGVAHDLNNILSGIVSYPELILMELPEDSSLRRPLQTIQKSGAKAAAIVQDLLTLARRGVEVADTVNLNLLVIDYLSSPEHDKLRLHHPRVRIRKELDGHLLSFLGSPLHLSKVVMNLVTNAAEAMPEGGEICIATANRYIDTYINGYDNVSEGDYATLTVSDTGIGIAPEDRERIFEPFFTKKVMGRSGTGLGMAVVWGTVKDHKGYIDFQSEPGQGTVFTLYFPATRRELHNTGATEDLTQDITGRGESILVVDDILDQRIIATQMLKKLGYRTAAVGSGEEAVAYLKRQPVDLLVLDMIMEPGMDGCDTYQQVQKIRPGIRTVIASGFSESDRVKAARRLGAGCYLKKPYTLQQLGGAVRGELDREGALQIER